MLFSSFSKQNKKKSCHFIIGCSHEQYAIINQACFTYLDSLVIQPQDFIYMLTCPDTFQTRELHKGRDSYVMVPIHIFTPPPFLNISFHSVLNYSPTNWPSIIYLSSIDQSSCNQSIPPHLSQCSPFLSFMFTFILVFNPFILEPQHPPLLNIKL